MLRESLVSNSLALKRKWWIGRCKMPLRGKVQKRDFSTSLGNPARGAGIPTSSPAPAATGNFERTTRTIVTGAADPLDPYDEASSSFDDSGVGGLIQTAVGWGGCLGRAWVKRSGLRA